MKIFTAGFIGLIVTGVLLLLMSQLINSDHQVVEKQKVVTLVDTPLPPEKQPKTNRLPKPQPPAVAPSAGEAVPLRASTIDTPDIPTVDFEPVDVSYQAPIIGAPAPHELLDSRSALPLFQAQPNYPIIAASQGIEGWVLLQYDVDTSGTLSNINVLDAQPRRTFDKEAVAALKKWKFRPAMDNGQPISVKGQTVKIEFNLEQER
ncbi:energy transducer TonB [Kangiella aquimarina]|uniref:Protein TonB n=1 Tax=Kangiella aquimarina TaxID=261965 RepID=A0ABZ0X3Z6_9GAMM|nr:energy transducer TonB [Kangiella aquimarina]WQG85109.1 energy transducer TonB [Kangiella aquimarina]